MPECSFTTLAVIQTWILLIYLARIWQYDWANWILVNLFQDTILRIEKKLIWYSI